MNSRARERPRPIGYELRRGVTNLMGSPDREMQFATILFARYPRASEQGREIDLTPGAGLG